MKNRSLAGHCFFWTHHESILHSDDGAVQDGWRHWGDLQQLPLPALALPLWQGLSPQVGYQLLDLLALSFGKEGLGLIESGLGHHHPGRAVLHLCEDLYGLTLKRRWGDRSASQTARDVR